MQISGFKNLMDVDVHFGPFTCIAGINGVGKSNLFDAIRFLGDLMHMPLVEAAKSVRSEGQKNSDIRDLFHKVGDEYELKMRFVIDMIIPEHGSDDLGQIATARITTVRYELILSYRQSDIFHPQGLLEITKEELHPIPLVEARKVMRFAPAYNLSAQDQRILRKKELEWQNSVIKGRRTVPFISTTEGEERIINFHQDSGGQPVKIRASTLPKTVLSTANALENPTASLVKKEMRSWQMLQLEPSALRKSDEFYTIPNARLGADGSHLPATLYRLKLEEQQSQADGDVYQRLANKLSGLVDNVASITVEKDDKREMLTLMLKSRDGTVFPARSLSDGTLRFLGLSVLELDYKSGGVICLEEPENGIHPEKIKQILDLLQEICTDIRYPVGDDNPLRQVIINSHSPSVVQLVPEDSLLMAQSKRNRNSKGDFYDQVVYSPLRNTWRTRIEGTERNSASLDKLIAYLTASPRQYESDHLLSDIVRSRRVIEREDVKQLQIDFGS
ncbi:AAA family ATPase [Spirosoma spitsbergense]|uniref:AAA family ATPase n=1 Tax=Spirosoma spitsbergense TaxID=431554 RepID=UPI003CCBDC5E